MEPKWLEYAKKLQAIAQAGLAYSKDIYDIERFQQIREISLEIFHEYTGIDQEIIRDLFAKETGYPTPKIDVRAAVFKENKILLVKERADNLWALPGGWADIDTSLRESLLKEAKEEAGIDINPKRIIAIFDTRKHNLPPAPSGIYKIIVECEYLGGEFQNNIETLECGFFSLDHLPPLSIGRNTYKQIELCFEVHNKEFHEAIFD